MQVTNSKILSNKEIHLIRTILDNQGIHTEIPEEALNLVSPKIATSENTLLYMIHVPELEPEESTIIRIYPVNQNNSVIKDFPQFVIKQSKQLFTTSKPENYVQLNLYIKQFKDSCSYPLIMGNEPLCLMERNEITSAKLISNNKVFISNAKNQELSSNCGPSNRQLLGSFVVSFSNCTITYMGQNFTSIEKISENETIQGALHDLIVSQKTIKHHDVAKIEEVVLSNRNHLDRVSLQQETDQKWKWSLLGGMSLSSFLLLTVLILIYFHLKATQWKTPRKANREKVTKEVSNNPSKDNHPSAEDDTFSPPPMNYDTTRAVPMHQLEQYRCTI